MYWCTSTFYEAEYHNVIVQKKIEMFDEHTHVYDGERLQRRFSRGFLVNYCADHCKLHIDKRGIVLDLCCPLTYCGSVLKEYKKNSLSNFWYE